MLTTRPHSLNLRGAALLLLIALASSGCSKTSGQPELAPVAGLISLDGKPVSDATVTFYFTGASMPGYSTSLARTDVEGKFELISRGSPGAVPGAYKVTVSRIVLADGATVDPEEGMDMQQLARQGLAKESLPERYSSFDRTELNVTVEKEKTDGYDFALTSS